MNFNTEIQYAQFSKHTYCLTTKAETIKIKSDAVNALKIKFQKNKTENLWMKNGLEP